MGGKRTNSLRSAFHFCTNMQKKKKEISDLILSENHAVQFFLTSHLTNYEPDSHFGIIMKYALMHFWQEGPQKYFAYFDVKFLIFTFNLYGLQLCITRYVMANR